MYSLTISPNHKFTNFFHCIAFDQAQQFTNEFLDPTPFTQASDEFKKYNKVLAAHSVMKKNIKPVISILLLVSNDKYDTLAIFQFMVKPIAAKRQTDPYSQTPQFELYKIWEVGGNRFNPKDEIWSYETLYNSKSPRLIETTTLDVFLSAVTSRTNDFANKDTRSLGKSAMIFDKKAEICPSVAQTKESLPIASNSPVVEATIQENLSKHINLSIHKLAKVLNNIESTTPPEITIDGDSLYLKLNDSKTKIQFNIEFIKNNPNTAFNELLFLSIDPYLIIDCFKELGIEFKKLSYSNARSLAKQHTVQELISFKGLEAHFDVVINELHRRKILI